MAPKARLSRSKGPLRKAGNEMLKAKPGSPETKALENTPAPKKDKAINGSGGAVPSKEDSAKLAKLLKDIFNCYDQDEDGRIERVEWLEGEEKRLGKLEFGPKVRKATVAWFKEAGAEGNLTDGMYLNFEKFQTAYLATSVHESSIPEDEPLKLSEWIMEEKAKQLLQVCCKNRPSSRQNATNLLPELGAPTRGPAYPLTCDFKEVQTRVEEARQCEKMVLILQSGSEDVETFLKYRNNIPIDAKQLLGEMFVKKSKSKKECAAEVGEKLKRGMYSSGFCKPLWIHMSNTAFDWNSFCCDQFPDEVFSGSRWTIENAFKRGMIDEGEKMTLECENEKKWQDFHVIITSRFDLEGAETHLKDKLPFYDELAIIVVDPASLA